jgi:hypothetical protein
MSGPVSRQSPLKKIGGRQNKEIEKFRKEKMDRLK